MGYLSSLYFKDIFQYLAQNRLASKKSAMRKVEILAEKYILLDSLLFKLITIPGKEAALLVIPETCADKIITLYHSNLFAGHQGVIKTYLTINDNYRPLLRLNMDLKIMPRSSRGHRYILCVIDEVMNYMITASIKHSRSEEVREALINDLISKYWVPDYMIMDLDSACMSSLMNYLFKRLGIKIKRVAPYNHQSLQAEHAIKSLSNILTKHLTGLGEMWPDYLSFATLVHNTYNSLNLSNYSPYELVFGRKLKLLLDLETDPDIKVSETCKEYYEKLEKRLKYLHKILQDFKTLCYMAILKEGFSAYSSPMMLISRRLSKDKRVVTDFRHLKVRIAKNNLTYPLVMDMFSVLGNSKCEVLSVLDLKDVFHLLRLSENSKRYCGILRYFCSSSYLYQRCLWD